MSTPTLRRLDDRERYFGLTWPGWAAVVTCGGLLVFAVRLSPLGIKPTITITTIALTFVGMVLHGVSGQALSPGRQLLAIATYQRSPKLLELADRVQRRGLVLDAAPPPSNQPELDIDQAWADHQAWEDSFTSEETRAPSDETERTLELQFADHGDVDADVGHEGDM